MSEYAVMPINDYISACDTIKEKTGSDSNHIKSGKLPEKIAEVYEKGIENGKQAQYEEFWDNFQDYGKQGNYSAAFQTNAWTDETYNPKYDIVPAVCNSMFSQNEKITDTKVAIDVSASYQSYYMFQNATAMVTIRSLKVRASQSYTNFFQGCSKLKNITFAEGSEIGRTISFADSPLLTVDSMISVIEHLVNYIGTADEGRYSVTFTADCWARLNDYSEAAENMTWQEYVRDVLGWNAV